MGGGVAAPNSAKLGFLAPRLTSPALPCGSHSPNTDRVFMHLHPGVPSTWGNAPVSPAGRTQKVLLLQLVQGHQPVWAGQVSDHRDGMRPSPDFSASRREADRPQAPLQGAQGVTDLPTGPWGGTAGWQTRGIPASAGHEYRGELYEVDGVIGQKWLNTIRKVE